MSTVRDRERPSAKVLAPENRTRKGPAAPLRRWITLRAGAIGHANLTADEAESLAAELVECARRVRAELEGAT
ncbi:MAG: hypothetical protein K2V38_05485 [Gemmataceae bacterium]|nr:hypothetical protein [Gemmataceae bacterium]